MATLGAQVARAQAFLANSSTLLIVGGYAAPVLGHQLIYEVLRRMLPPASDGGRVVVSSPVPRAGRPATHPITITFDAERPGPVVGDDFAGLSFERGPLDPGHSGVAGYLFSPGNNSLVTLFRNLGLRNLRVGGGSVDQLVPAGTGSDGFTGIDNLFAFAAAAGVKVIYTLRMLSPAASPVDDLHSVNARVAGYIWGHYRDSVDSFAGLADLLGV